MMENLIDILSDIYTSEAKGKVNVMSKRIITLGTWGGNPIEWIILKKDKFTSLCISKQVLFDYYFNYSKSSASYYGSDIRKFLNGDFWAKAFTDSEKKNIVNAKLSDSYDAKDDVFLLSKEEIENYMTSSERQIGRLWWTRTAYNKDYIYNQRANYDSFDYNGPTNRYGVRPGVYIVNSAIL